MARCVVKSCRNSMETQPHKFFFLIPQFPLVVREKWFASLGIEGTQLGDNFLMSAYCCEDHFDLSEDVLCLPKLPRTRGGVVQATLLKENRYPRAEVLTRNLHRNAVVTGRASTDFIDLTSESLDSETSSVVSDHCNGISPSVLEPVVNVSIPESDSDLERLRSAVHSVNPRIRIRDPLEINHPNRPKVASPRETVVPQSSALAEGSQSKVQTPPIHANGPLLPAPINQTAKIKSSCRLKHLLKEFLDQGPIKKCVFFNCGKTSLHHPESQFVPVTTNQPAGKDWLESLNIPPSLVGNAVLYFCKEHLNEESVRTPTINERLETPPIKSTKDTEIQFVGKVITKKPVGNVITKNTILSNEDPKTPTIVTIDDSSSDVETIVERPVEQANLEICSSKQGKKDVGSDAIVRRERIKPASMPLPPDCHHDNSKELLCKRLEFGDITDFFTEYYYKMESSEEQDRLLFDHLDRIKKGSAEILLFFMKKVDINARIPVCYQAFCRALAIDPTLLLPKATRYFDRRDREKQLSASSGAESSACQRKSVETVNGKSSETPSSLPRVDSSGVQDTPFAFKSYNLCQFCLKLSTNAVDYEIHRRGNCESQSRKEFPIECEVCKKFNANSVFELKHHVQTCHKYVCSLCGENCLKLDDICRHLKACKRKAPEIPHGETSSASKKISLMKTCTVVVNKSPAIDKLASKTNVNENADEVINGGNGESSRGQSRDRLDEDSDASQLTDTGPAAKKRKEKNEGLVKRSRDRNGESGKVRRTSECVDSNDGKDLNECDESKKDGGGQLSGLSDKAWSTILYECGYYKCPICCKECNNPLIMNLHLTSGQCTLSRTEMRQALKLHCKICSRPFSTRPALGTHLRTSKTCIPARVVASTVKSDEPTVASNSGEPSGVTRHTLNGRANPSSEEPKPGKTEKMRKDGMITSPLRQSNSAETSGKWVSSMKSIGSDSRHSVRCKTCCKFFLKEQLEEHYAKNEACDPRRKGPSNYRHSSPNLSLYPARKRYYKCPACTYECKGDVGMYAHFSKHASPKRLRRIKNKYQCFLCQMKFKETASLYKHLFVEHPKQFMCPICVYQSESFSSFFRHARINHKIS